MEQVDTAAWDLNRLNRSQLNRESQPCQSEQEQNNKDACVPTWTSNALEIKQLGHEERYRCQEEKKTWTDVEEMPVAVGQWGKEWWHEYGSGQRKVSRKRNAARLKGWELEKRLGKQSEVSEKSWRTGKQTHKQDEAAMQAKEGSQQRSQG